MENFNTQKQKLYPKTLHDDQIRLLRWTDNADITCHTLYLQMLDVTLQEAPYYCALSYRWEDHDPAYPDIKIKCNDVDIPVGLNLFNALTRLRDLPSRRAYLWVDFICIEQSNDEEKQHQLLLMPQIYQRASRVFVWLGPGTVESDAAVDNLVGMTLLMKAADMSQQPDTESELSKDEAKTFNHLLNLVQHSNAGATTYFEPVWKLLSRDWFGRVWTVQEAAADLNRCIALCGNKIFPYKIISDLTSGFFDAKDGDSHWIKVVDSLRPKSIVSNPENPNRPILAHSKAVWKLHRLLHPLSPERPDRLTAVEFLNDLRVLECSDPRDRIFTATPFLYQSLIDLIRERNPIATEELYTLFAVADFELRKDLDCLAAAGLCFHRRMYPEKYPVSPTTPHISIPSWVPDWSYPKVCEPLWCLNNRSLEYNEKRLYEASGNTKPDISVILSDTGKSVVLRGVVIDTVLEASNRFRIGIMPVDCEANELAEALRDRMSLEIAQVDSYVSLALECTSPASAIETTQTVHKVRKALLGDILPTKINGLEGRLYPADSKQIDKVFERAQTDLDYWNKLLGERVSGTRYTPSPEELAAQEREDAEWKRIHRSSPALSICLATTLKGRRFFVSEELRFGIGPSILLPGDKICVFLGGNTPFVIRPVESSDASQAHDTGTDKKYAGNEAKVEYQLIGECYVNDLMHGEAMNMENVRMQDIYLV